ncbi:MAG: THUMP domain-containing class I SAM-dependent RNA methyltransferase [Patescibacteria group bacterium]
MQIDLIATAAFGLEAVVARELRMLGYEPAVSPDGGRLAFTADLFGIARANLWLRAADRVLLKMGSFPAATFTELFEGTKSLPWPDWLPADAACPVAAKCVRSRLMSVPDSQAIVKKAVVESMKSRFGYERLPETGASFRIEVSLLRDMATIALDTSGLGLHKRGYRTLSAPAPLKETLAAGLILLSRWRPGQAFLDPCCGSGTLPIEAALIGLNIAPGIRRTFAAEAWPAVPAAAWIAAREEAADLALPWQKLEIRGSDLDPEAVSLAGFHARRAGVGREVSLRVLPAAAAALDGPGGVVVCNPPYGERIGESSKVEKLYRDLGRLYRAAPGWSFNILTAHPGFERLFGRRAGKRRKLYNGRIECRYYQY